MIKAVAFDIDGTLTDGQRRLDPISIEAVRMLKVPAILCTGNVHCFTRSTSILLGTPRIFVSENGGVVSYGEGNIEYTGDKNLCEKAYSKLIEFFPLKRYDSRYRITDIVVERDFDLSKARDLLDDHGLEVDLIDSEFAVHIKDRKADKGAALLKVMDHMGLEPHEVAAVGDSVSDLPMFDVVGFKAAVANALPEVKKAADYVSLSCYGQGTYEIVKYLIEERLI